MDEVLGGKGREHLPGPADRDRPGTAGTRSWARPLQADHGCRHDGPAGETRPVSP